MDVSRDRKRDERLYRRLYLIRRAEQEIQAHYGDDRMKTPVHLSLGQEAIAVGVCDALGPVDRLFGTYRSHALYLARTGETDRFFAELYGRATGCARGKAGSMHLAAPEHGLLACSAVVGTTIPLALGAAFAARYRAESTRVAVFFGDGATEEGVFWESLNFAALRRLPVLFVCEDNGLAIHARAERRRGYDALERIVARFRCSVFGSDSTDAAAIAALTEQALGSPLPALLHLRCYRYVEHVGPRIDRDFELGHRRREEFEAWSARDPVALMRARLLREGLPESRLAEFERAIDEQVVTSRARAAAEAPPAPTELLEHVFAPCRT